MEKKSINEMLVNPFQKRGSVMDQHSISFAGKEKARDFVKFESISTNNMLAQLEN